MNPFYFFSVLLFTKLVNGASNICLNKDISKSTCFSCGFDFYAVDSPNPPFASSSCALKAEKVIRKIILIKALSRNPSCSACLEKGIEEQENLMNTLSIF